MLFQLLKRDGNRKFLVLFWETRKTMVRVRMHVLASELLGRRRNLLPLVLS